MSPRTVFSLISYDISIGGYDFDGKDIADMKLIRKSEHPAVRGIVSSELILKLRTDLVFLPNAAVKVELTGACEMSFGRHFISSISRNGDIITIHAFDRMRMTENDFDDSAYEEDGTFLTSQVVEDIAQQCGFAHIGQSFGKVLHIHYSNIHGKTCREILNFLAENAVGAWYCSDSEQLKFTPFLTASMSVGVECEKSSPMYRHSDKGPFSAVCARNTAVNKVFLSGSGTDFRHVLKISGRLFDSERTAAAMSAVAGKSRKAFYCKHASVTAAPCGLAEFIFGDVYGLISEHTVIRFGAGGVYALADAPDICEDESDYRDLKDYEIRKRVETDRKYGCTVVTEKGVGFTAGNDTDLGAADISYFSAEQTGVVKFDGTIIDGVMPDSITKSSDGSHKIKYGNCVYRLSYDTDGNGNKSNISFLRETEE